MKVHLALAHTLVEDNYGNGDAFFKYKHVYVCCNKKPGSNMGFILCK